MSKMIRKGEFLEYADVHGNFYGTSFAAVKTVTEQRKVCVLDIDVKGAESVKLSDLNARCKSSSLSSAGLYERVCLPLPTTACISLCLSLLVTTSVYHSAYHCLYHSACYCL